MAPFLRVIDLTRPLDETTALWPGTPPMVVEPTETIERDGSFSRRVTLDEHSGTHFDAPSHFREGAGHVADVPASRASFGRSTSSTSLASRGSTRMLNSPLRT